MEPSRSTPHAAMVGKFCSREAYAKFGLGKALSQKAKYGVENHIY